MPLCPQEKVLSSAVPGAATDLTSSYELDSITTLLCEVDLYGVGMTAFLPLAKRVILKGPALLKSKTKRWYEMAIRTTRSWTPRKKGSCMLAPLRLISLDFTAE